MRGFLAVALGVMSALPASSQPTSFPVANTGASRRVPAPGPSVYADAILQEAIDAVAAAGGGVVELGTGDFKLSRHPGDETVVIKSGITLRGQGYATHIYLDPKTPPNKIRYYPVRIGTARVPASNVVVENLRYTGNNACIGGGSVMGFNARLDDPAGLLLSCDNVTVRNCWIYDAQQAAGCTKPGSTQYDTPERLASQFKNWQVRNNFIDTCGNKAVELAECNGGLIAGNYITNVNAGPQVIFGSRNVQISDNQVFFTDTGINITEGSNHIRVTGNHAEPVPAIKRGSGGSCLLFRTEPLAHKSVISHVVVTGNVFRDSLTRQRATLKFITRKESQGCRYEAINVTGNVFDGDVLMLDKTTPAQTTLRDILFADNICEGNIISVPRATMDSSRIIIRGNLLRGQALCVLRADGWIWSDNTHVNGSLEIAADAKGNIVNNNVTPAAIVDHGRNTHLANNVLRPDEP